MKRIEHRTWFLASGNKCFFVLSRNLASSDPRTPWSLKKRRRNTSSCFFRWALQWLPPEPWSLTLWAMLSYCWQIRRGELGLAKPAWSQGPVRCASPRTADVQGKNRRKKQEHKAKKRVLASWFLPSRSQGLFPAGPSLQAETWPGSEVKGTRPGAWGSPDPVCPSPSDRTRTRLALVAFLQSLLTVALTGAQGSGPYYHRFTFGTCWGGDNTVNILRGCSPPPPCLQVHYWRNTELGLGLGFLGVSVGCEAVCSLKTTGSTKHPRDWAGLRAPEHSWGHPTKPDKDPADGPSHRG